MAAYLLKLKPYIQPFERQPAIDELRKIAKSEPRPLDAPLERAVDFRIDTAVDPKLLADRLAYWESFPP